MVSFWPFKGDETSAASFEKTLSKLSDRITKAQTKNDGFRQHQRRYKALWTLYSSFVYILAALILTLVTGWDKWQAAEYTGMAGGPLLIYGVRMALDTYYNFRLSKSEEYLAGLYKQRDQAIEKLKAATKYNSTQQLLDKYGGSPRRPSPNRRASDKRKVSGQPHGSAMQQQQGTRTGFAPPATANIPSRQAAPQPLKLQPPPSSGLAPPAPSQAGEEFAPNAFAMPRQRPSNARQPSMQYANDGPKWYDRMMDLLMGEDETQAKNRIVLICQNCRLVNGQAPPGARTEEDIGRWRCSACHTMNGKESEASRVLRHAGGEVLSPVSPVSDNGLPDSTSANKDVAEDMEAVSEDDSDDANEHTTGDVGEDNTHEPPPAASTRSKTRQKKKS